MVPIAIEDLAGHRVVVRRDSRLRGRRLRGGTVHGANRHEAGRQVGRAAQQPTSAHLAAGHRALVVVRAHAALLTKGVWRNEEFRIQN